MTEKEWMNCTDPEVMLEHLDRPQGDRKLFLFALACCRNIWLLLPQAEMREGVKVAEDFADGKATQEELDAADWRLEGALYYGGVELFANRPGTRRPEELFHWLAEVRAIPGDQLRAMACCGGENLPAHLLTLFTNAGYFADHVLSMNTCEFHDPTLAWYRRFLQTSLARDIFANPFRPTPPIPQAVLAWNDAVVVRLAQAAYEERHLPEGTLDNGRLAILADALEEAGCTSEEMLGHLRGAGPHVRGCWVVDVCLEKS